MVKRSWMDTAEFQHKEDHPEPRMRPSFNKLISKLKRLDSLQEHPEAVVDLISALAHWSFVFERNRPAHAFTAFQRLNSVLSLALGSPHGEKANDAVMEMASNPVTTEDDPEIVSLVHVTTHKGHLRDEVRKGNDRDTTIVEHEIGCGGWNNCTCGSRKNYFRAINGLPPRNNTTPGPSHKSPVAYSSPHVGFGFTIPGVKGRFIWHGDGDTPANYRPDMKEVVDILAAGLGEGVLGRSPEIDLDDKGLKKRVRQIIWKHTFGAFDDSKGRKQTECACGELFDIGEEWAVHVRKLIWKELKRA